MKQNNTSVMEQFSIEKYLANPERKVVTRNRKNVRIICTNCRGSFPVIGLKESETICSGIQ